MTFLNWIMRLGPSNPVAVRLVHNASCRMRHLYIRTGYLAILMIVLLWSLLVQAGPSQLSYRELAAAGASSFAATAYLQIGLICLIAPLFMAGAIAQEANPRTWDILLTTPLSASQIVIGNLLGRLYLIIALLLSSLPLFALTQYFGGVPGRTVLHSYVIAVCAATLVGAIAITISVVRIAGRRSVLFFYIAVVTYLAVTWAADLALRGNSLQVTWLTPLNPFLVQESLLNPTRYAPLAATDLTGAGWLTRLWLTNPVGAMALWTLLASALLIVFGATTVRIIASTGGTLWQRPGARSQKNRAARSVWKNPIAWREASTRATSIAKRLSRWVFILLGVGWGVVILVMHHRSQTITANHEMRLTLVATLLTETLIIVLLALNMSATSVSREREDGTLDLLLTTPISPRAYLWGKLRGLLSFFIPLLLVPTLTIAMAAIYVQAGGFGAPAGTTINNAMLGTTTPIILPIAGLLYPLITLPFLAFCVVVGLQWSVKSKGTIGASIGTIGMVGAIAGVIGLCGWSMSARVAVLGPILASLNPASALYVLCNPDTGAEKTLENASYSISALNNTMLFGALIATAIYAFVVWAIITSMVKSFDMTVRKLAGTK
ncbi:MAG: ABC transporter permease subunit [Phycisphaerales bacterium JB043]